MSTLLTKIQLRRDTYANLQNIFLAQAEPAYDTTYKMLRLGDGLTAYKNLNILVDDKYVASRGENLLTNGTALLGNNYNFMNLTFDGSRTYFAAGSFRKESWAGYGAFTNDEFIPVDVNQNYLFDFYTMTNTDGAQINGMITAFDIDKKQISPYQVAPRANTLTTLARALNPGDTKIYLTDMSHWSNVNLNTNNSSILVYGYTNSFGYTYEPETYTQYRYTALWSNASQMDYDNNVITLNRAWSGPAFEAGRYISQGQDGSGALYCSIDDIGTTATLHHPNEWEHHWYHINGLQSKNTFPQSKFPFGTAYIKVGLMNRPLTISGQTVNQNFNISTMSFSAKQSASDVHDGILTIQKNGTTVTTFSANSAANKTANITVPVASITNTAGSESVTIDGKTLNVVTRDITQTISGAKTFSISPILNNNVYLNAKTSSGTAINLIGVTSGNNIAINPSGVGNNVFYTTLRPNANNTVDLGTSSYKWKDLYLTGNLSDGTNSITVAKIENTDNKVTSLSSSSTNIQYPSAKCVYDAIEDVRETAEGKTNNYVIDDTTHTEFNSQASTIHLIGTTFLDANNHSHNIGSLKTGDTLYVIQTEVPDRWVGNVQLNQTVTSLLNTEWIFDDALSSIVGNWTTINLNFTANNTNYTVMKGYTSSGRIHLQFGNSVVYNAENDGWINENYKNITITGGLDVEAASVISWLNNNAILQGEAYNATLYMLETAKVPVLDVQVRNPGDSDYASIVTNGIAQVNLTNYMALTGAQTAAGRKTFSNGITINGSGDSNALILNDGARINGPSNRTVFGFNSDSSGFLMNHPYYKLILRGATTRPYYITSGSTVDANTPTLALYSDIPDVTISDTGTGDFISDIEVDTTNKHQINVTRASAAAPNDGLLTFQVNGTTAFTFSANQADPETYNLNLSTVMKYKGSVNNYSDLPASGQETGDVWNVVNADPTHGINAGDNVCWNGTGWDNLGGAVDLSGYATLSGNNTFTGNNTFNNTITGSISGNAATATTANKVANALTIGSGSTTWTYNGSATKNIKIAAGTGISASANSSTGVITITNSAPNTDTKMKVTTNATQKNYLVGVRASDYVSGTAVEGFADTGIYMDTEAGALHATKFVGAVMGDADSVDNYHMTQFGYKYKGVGTVNFLRKTKGTITNAQKNALTPNDVDSGDIYIISDDNNKRYCAVKRTSGGTTTLTWSLISEPYLSYPELSDNDEPIYIKVTSQDTYATSFVDFYVAPSYDNVSGSTEIREYCRARNVYYADAVNYNGNKLVGIYQPSSNTNIWYFKFSKMTGTYTAVPGTYSGVIIIYMNQNIISTELITPEHADYNAVVTASYFETPVNGIKTTSTVFQTINGETVGSSPKFTDTATAVDNILDGSNSGTAITYAPYSSRQNKLSFDRASSNPTGTSRLNLNGYFYATKVYSNGSEVLTANQSISINSGKDKNNNDIIGTASATAPKLGTSGLTAGSYSYTTYNAQGIAIDGGNILEVGTVSNATASTALAKGGIFFMLIEE